MPKEVPDAFLHTNRTRCHVKMSKRRKNNVSNMGVKSHMVCTREAELADVSFNISRVTSFTLGRGLTRPHVKLMGLLGKVGKRTNFVSSDWSKPALAAVAISICYLKANTGRTRRTKSRMQPSHSADGSWRAPSDSSTVAIMALDKRPLSIQMYMHTACVHPQYVPCIAW